MLQPNTGTTPARRHIPMYVRQAVFERDGEACVTCHSASGLILDHVIPVVHGGPDTVDNLYVSCRACVDQKTHASA